ncbi:MAG: biopolymer transporter ExbD [Candidatus Aminicenantes bacterium]|nr:biopolymer transporter ExbD [Candidatus Aminicenantes bacterium]
MATNAEPNVVPLCDVLLVLLIIFMIITPMIQKGMDVRLPETASETSSGGSSSNVIVVTLKPDNTILINQEQIDYNLAQDRLRNLYATRQDKTVFVRAYASVSYNRVVEMIDMLRGAGCEVLALVPEYIEEESN